MQSLLTLLKVAGSMAGCQSPIAGLLRLAGRIFENEEVDETVAEANHLRVRLGQRAGDRS